MSVAARDERARYRELRARRLAPLPGAALVWCAFAPGWPEEVVAELSSATPPIPFDLRLLERAVEQHALERLPGGSPWEEPVYRMSGTLRTAAVEQLLESSREPVADEPQFSDVRRELVAAGTAMLRASKVAYDPTLRRWAQVAAAAGDDESLVAFLDARVTEAIEAARQSGSVAAPEALRWIEVVEPLAHIFKGTLEAAVTMARGQRELFYRRADDERRLANYYPPPDVQPRLAREQAFHDLLRDAEHWALHYVGSGGGGKTMLLRYIANRLAPQANALVARVDFDFLNPDYPLTQPGMLLARFAEELRLQAGEQGAFGFFDAKLKELNGWIAQERAAGRDGIVTVRHQKFRETIDAFARACRRLERTVVLMLDTCEELAKLRGNQVPENVQVTFDVLMALRDEDRLGRRLRVVFSGRRALASSGFGWTAPESPLPPREFLRLFRVRGFTEVHARGFLSSYRVGGVGVRADLHDDILRLSHAITSNADDEQTARFLPPVPDDDLRFNPYDVDMYADWAAAVEAVAPLTRERLERAGPHFYIEERIAKRLSPEVWHLLPALTLLGRFDRPLLDTLVARSSGAAALVLEIIEQEWVRPDRSVAGDKWFIDDGLLARLRRYFTEQRPGALDDGRRRLAEVLPELTLTRPFAQLAEHYFVATFEALRDRPEQAAEWWLAVEQRILESGAWESWALPLASTLLSDPVMAPERQSSFRPAVLALQAAALLHSGGTISQTAWQQVHDSIDAYPAVFGRERLRYRLACAWRQLTGEGVLGAPPDQDDPQCWGALVAAMEAAVEREELERRSLSSSSPPSSATAGRKARQGVDPLLLRSAPDAGVRAFGLMLQARLLALDGAREAAVEGFAAASNLATGATDARWLDWIPPDDLRARVLLESVRAVGVLPPLSLGVGMSDSLDGDRLAAVQLLLHDADEPQRNVTVPLSPLRAPRCNAHREVPPCEVVAAEILARERPADAIERLKAVAQRAAEALLADAAADANRAIARTIRRQRLLSEGWPLPSSITLSSDPIDVRLRVTTRALHISAEAAARALADVPNPRPARLPGGRRASAEALLEWAEVAQFTKAEGVESAWLEAEALFEEVSDDAGILRARFARATWLARHAKRVELTELLDRHQPLFTPLGSMNVKSALYHVTEVLDRFEHDWRPWAARILAAALTVADDSRLPLTEQRRDLAQWVRDHYLVELDGASHLPAEIVLVDEATGEVPGPVRPSPQPARPASSKSSLLAIAGYFLVGLGIIGVILFGSFWLTSAVVPDWPTAVRWVIAVVALPAGAWLASRGVPMLMRGYWSAVLAATEVAFTVALERRPEDLNRPLTVPWSFRSRTRILFVNTGSKAVTKPAVEEQRYEKLRERLDLRQPAFVERLFAIFDIVLPVKVTIEPAAAAAPWEVVFGLTSPGRPLEANRIQVFRSLSAHRTPPQPDWLGHVEMLTWLSPGLHLDRGAFSFRKTTSGGEWAIVSATAETVRQYEEPRASAGVVHVIGTPIERQGTVYLQIGGIESAADSAGFLLSVEDLVRRYPAMRILVVQNTPSGSRDRTSSDRLEAAYLKRIGATAFQSGVPAVVVVPTIPPQVTPQIVSLIVDVLQRNRGNGRRQVITAHRAMQQRIAAAWSAFPEAVAIALDCCLYVSDRVNLRIAPHTPSPVTPSSTNGAST